MDRWETQLDLSLSLTACTTPWLDLSALDGRYSMIKTNPTPPFCYEYALPPQRSPLQQLHLLPQPTKRGLCHRHRQSKHFCYVDPSPSAPTSTDATTYLHLEDSPVAITNAGASTFHAAPILTWLEFCHYNFYWCQGMGRSNYSIEIDQVKVGKFKWTQQLASWGGGVVKPIGCFRENTQHIIGTTDERGKQKDSTTIR